MLLCNLLGSFEVEALDAESSRSCHSEGKSFPYSLETRKANKMHPIFVWIEVQFLPSEKINIYISVVKE